MEDVVDAGVGFVISAKPGMAISRGDHVATIYARDEAGIRQGRAVLSEAITIGDTHVDGLPLIATRISSDGTEEWRPPA